eukprot:jgi/Phyca11/504084/fgenesh2_kg.PHYCAscaffold_6_\
MSLKKGGPSRNQTKKSKRSQMPRSENWSRSRGTMVLELLTRVRMSMPKQHQN